MAGGNKTGVLTKVDGLRAVELYYRTIRDISAGSTAFYQSRTQLNTPGLGTLLPENFRGTAEVTMQCVELFELEFIQSLEAVRKFTDRDLIFNWVSVYMPVKFLQTPNPEKKLTEVCNKFEVPPTKICFALSSSILSDDFPGAPQSIRLLRSAGFHFMITDFCGTDFPIMRLSDIEADYVMLSPAVISRLGESQRSDSAVAGLIAFADSLGAESIADGVTGSRQAELLYEMDCRYCAGSLTGKYMAERYIRNRSDRTEE